MRSTVAIRIEIQTFILLRNEARRNHIPMSKQLSINLSFTLLSPLPESMVEI
jgi:hypothetical protein